MVAELCRGAFSCSLRVLHTHTRAHPRMHAHARTQTRTHVSARKDSLIWSHARNHIRTRKHACTHAEPTRQKHVCTCSYVINLFSLMHSKKYTALMTGLPKIQCKCISSCAVNSCAVTENHLLNLKYGENLKLKVH